MRATQGRPTRAGGQVMPTPLERVRALVDAAEEFGRASGDARNNVYCDDVRKLIALADVVPDLVKWASKIAPCGQQVTAERFCSEIRRTRAALDAMTCDQPAPPREGDA